MPIVTVTIVSAKNEPKSLLGEVLAVRVVTYASVNHGRNWLSCTVMPSYYVEDQRSPQAWQRAFLIRQGRQAAEVLFLEGTWEGQGIASYCTAGATSPMVVPEMHWQHNSG